MTDTNGERVLSLLDETNVTDETANEIIQIISQNRNFVLNWSEIARDSATLRIVPTKKAERKLISDHIQ